MKLAYISTINSLNEISSLGEIEYCIIPVALESFEYFSYFKQQSIKKKYIIADDSIAENGGVTPDKKLVETAIKLGVSEIVIPDVIGDYKKTKIKREKFIKKYYNILKKNNIKLQGVIQGKNLQEYMECLDELNNNKKVDVIGIPFRINYCSFKDASYDENNMMNRVTFIELVGKVDKPIHLLGCNLLSEIVLLNHIKNIRSCDSKLISRYGMIKKIHNLDDLNKPANKLEFNYNMSKEQISFAIKNISVLKRRLKLYGR